MRSLCVLVSLVWLTVPGEVWAATGPVVFVPLRDGDAHTIRMEVGVRTSFFLPERLLKASSGNKVDFPITPEADWKSLDIQPTGKSPSTNLNVLLPSGRLTFTLQLQRPDAPAPGCPVQMVIVLPPGVEEPELQRVPAFNGQCQQRLRADMAGLLFAKLSEERVMPPIVARFHSPAHQLELRTSSRSVGPIGMWFGFEIRNIGVTEYPVQGLAIGDGQTNKNYAMATLFATATGRAPAVLRPGRSLRGSVVAHNGGVLARRMVVQLLATPGVAVAAWSWEEARATPVPKPPPRSVGKVAIGVSGVWGRAQLTSAAGAAEWTPLRGGGVVVSYGVLRWLSVEGALTTFDTDQAGPEIGEATGASVRLAVQIHRGDGWVPFARFGVEPAVFRQGDRTRGSLLPTVGLGCHRWLGDHFVATLSASYAMQADVLDLAQLSFHLAYAWSL